MYVEIYKFHKYEQKMEQWSKRTFKTFFDFAKIGHCLMCFRKLVTTLNNGIRYRSCWKRNQHICDKMKNMQKKLSFEN